MLYTFLIPHNYKVFLAFNGQMGLEYFEEIKPDIVLLDLKMPDIDGLEVLKIIRKVSQTPVLSQMLLKNQINYSLYYYNINEYLVL